MNLRDSSYSVRVLGPDRKALSDASVILRADCDEFRLSCENKPGFYTTKEEIPKGEYRLTVTRKPYEEETRVVRVSSSNDPEVFILLKAGMPFYYRGKVKVPFSADDSKIALVVRDRTTLGGRRRGPLKEKRRIEVGKELAKKYGLKLEKADPALHGQGIFLCSFPPKTTAKKRAEICAALEKEESNCGLPILRADDKHAVMLTNELMVKFADHIDEPAVAKIAKVAGLRILRKYSALGNVFRMTSGQAASLELIRTINELAERDDVEWAEPNLATSVEEDAVTPTDYLYPEQWDHQIINTADAWQFLRNIAINRTFGSPNIVIGVVDSGVDPNHPDFSGNVSDGTTKIFSAFDFSNMVANNNSLASGHGTSCASAAASGANNASTVAGTNEGVCGVAGNCRILAIRRSGTEADYADIYLWAGGFDPESDDDDFPSQLSRGADVISSSIGLTSAIGSPTSGTMAAVFDKLTDDGRDGKGVLLFFSAANNGNDNDVVFERPWGMYSRCFSVAASTLQNDGVTEDRAGYSNFSSQTEFCAPSHDAYIGGAPLHNPPTNYGAFTATPTSGPEGHGTVGRPTAQTTLSANAAAGNSTIAVTNTAGLAMGQAVMIGAPGGANTEAHIINAVNGGTNQITLNRNLFSNQPNGAPVNASAPDYRSNFGGTSHATPLCAGTAALMLSANPQLTWIQVRDLMRETAIKIQPGETNANGRWQDVNGNLSNSLAYDGNPFFSEFYGYGRINTAAAVREAGWDIELVTPALDFNEVPEGDTVSRAVRFNVKSLWPANFNMTGVPSAPFTALSTTEWIGASSDSSTPREVYFWVTFTGTNAGDTITVADGHSVTVENPETEQTWVIPITAKVIEKPTAAIMLCLDRSGSMDFPSGIGTSKRIDVLRFSANIMIDVLHEDNGLGIVAFDHDPHDVLAFIGPVGPPVSPSNPFDQDRTDMKAAINNFNPNPSGNTAIGDGIERALLRLNPVSGYDSKSVIVFTDGKETASKRINEVAHLIDDRMFAVGLGKAQNVEPAALNEVTNANEGYTLLADDLGTDSIFKLAKYFLQIQASVNNEDIVVDPDGTLYLGQVHEIPFLVNEGDITLDVIAMVASPAMVDFHLRTPNGLIISPTHDVTTAGVTYGVGRNVAYYRLNLPVPLGVPEREGTWTALLALSERSKHRPILTHAEVHSDATTGAARSMPYSVLVHSYSNLRMKTAVSQSGYEPGSKMRISSSLTQYGIPLEHGCKVDAHIVSPTKQSVTVPLSYTSEGTHEAEFATSHAGVYQLRIRADGHSLRGRPFTREQVRTASVWRGGNRPDEPAPSDPNGKENFCRLLTCLLSEKNLSREFVERLQKQGINLDGVKECLARYCSDTTHVSVPPDALSRLRADYRVILSTLDDVLNNYR